MPLLFAVAPRPPAKGPADLPSLAPTNMAALKDLGTLNQAPLEDLRRRGKDATSKGSKLLPALGPKTDSRYEWRREQNPDRFCIGWDLYNARCYAVAKPEALTCEAFLPAATRQLQRAPGYLHGPADDIYHGASGNIHMQTCGSQYKIEIYDGSYCADTPVSVLGECTPWGVDECDHINLATLNDTIIGSYKLTACPAWPPTPPGGMDALPGGRNSKKGKSKRSARASSPLAPPAGPPSGPPAAPPLAPPSLPPATPPAVGSRNQRGYLGTDYHQHGNRRAYAALKADGSVAVWGLPSHGGGITPYGFRGPPTDAGYVDVYTNVYGFVARKPDGTLYEWGGKNEGGSGGPTDAGYTTVAGNLRAFAALKADGACVAWGKAAAGGAGEPTDKGYVSLFAAMYTFAALKAAGAIASWGESVYLGSPPTDDGYTSVAGTYSAMAALKTDGAITAWGYGPEGANGAPTDKGYVSILGSQKAFSAMKADGGITSWGDAGHGGTGEPTDKGYTSMYSAFKAFAALKEIGSVYSWGSQAHGGSSAPTDAGYTAIFATQTAFAALKVDGAVTAWGNWKTGGEVPTGMGNGFLYPIVAGANAFAARKADGNITTWGSDTNTAGAPTDAGYVSIRNLEQAFVAQKADGALAAWGITDWATNGETMAPANASFTFVTTFDLQTPPAP